MPYRPSWPPRPLVPLRVALSPVSKAEREVMLYELRLADVRVGKRPSDELIRMCCRQARLDGKLAL